MYIKYVIICLAAGNVLKYLYHVYADDFFGKLLILVLNILHLFTMFTIVYQIQIKTPMVKTATTVNSLCA